MCQILENTCLGTGGKQINASPAENKGWEGGDVSDSHGKPGFGRNVLARSGKALRDLGKALCPPLVGFECEAWKTSC